MMLNYDLAGGSVLGVPVNATSANDMLVGAFAFLHEESVLRILLTGKTVPSAGNQTITLGSQLLSSNSSSSLPPKSLFFLRG